MIHTIGFGFGPATSLAGQNPEPNVVDRQAFLFIEHGTLPTSLASA